MVTQRHKIAADFTQSCNLTPWAH